MFPSILTSRHRRTSTGHAAQRTTRSATLPMRTWPRPVRPCVGITIRSTSLFAAMQISRAGEPFLTRTENRTFACVAILTHFPLGRIASFPHETLHIQRGVLIAEWIAMQIDHMH